MGEWRCESCGAEYETSLSACVRCDGEEITRTGSDVESTLDAVTPDSEKAESFTEWGIVDWVVLGVMLAALASLVFGLLGSFG